MSDIWYLDGTPVNNFPGAARVISVGHMMAPTLELGRAAGWWDIADAPTLSRGLRIELEDAR